jgi:hypothetical protein
MLRSHPNNDTLILDEVTLKQLRTDIDGHTKEKSEFVLTLLKEISPDGVMKFMSSSITVWPGKREAYENYVQLMDWQEALDVEGLNFSERANLAVFGDVKVSCTCGAFLYFGYAYILTQLDAIYPTQNWEQVPYTLAKRNTSGTDNIEDRFPEIRNPDLVGVVCKHLDTVLYVVTMSVSKIAAAMKEMAKLGLIKVNQGDSAKEPEASDNTDQDDTTTTEESEEDDKK